MGRREVPRTVAILATLLVACASERTPPGACDDCNGGVHPPGILDAHSDDFHGKELARRNWDFGVCARCHGDDFRGGISKVSCVDCHEDGPTACTTCHRDAGGGAHAVHLTREVACASCHLVPARWDAPGHIVDDTAPAEVVIASGGTFDGERCTNAYCHGATLDAGGAMTTPAWDPPSPSPTTCGSCHGAPPPSHAPAQAQCATCHPSGAPHVDGTVQIGTTDGCDGCHGSGGDPAPPRDLSGNTGITAIGVGAHQAHLDAPSGLRGPIACATCHVVPETVTAPGHIDSGSPAEVAAALGWDRGTRTCGTAWCHGDARPVWTETGGAACGTCHGVPPTTPSHTPQMTLATCGGCHPFPSATAHIDGVVDVQ